MEKYRKTPGIHYSYIIRTPVETYHTTLSPSLPLVLHRIESTLIQLASRGELSLEEVGTRIEAARQFIEDIKERNKQIAASKIGNAVSKPGRCQSKEECKEKAAARRKRYREKKEQSEQPSTPHCGV